MKNFSNYEWRQDIGGGEQWVKTYDDGEQAYVFVTLPITKQKVIDAFDLLSKKSKENE
jgi:hypothetical protein